MRAGKVLLVGASLATAACATSRGIQVRALADPAAKLRYSGGPLAEARDQLALGNTGIALETLRQLQREQPDSPEAFAGIAACYHAMGRYDLERANYEYALAYAPNDSALLTALARTLDDLGQTAQAAQVRAELSQPKAGETADAAKSRITAIGIPQIASVTTKLPPANPPIGHAGALALQAHPTRPSLAFKLPQPRTTAQVRVAPHLERLSMAEVALVTASEPVWHRRDLAFDRHGQAMLRRADDEPLPPHAPVAPADWVPLKAADTGVHLRLLNAARREGLASANRKALMSHGWQNIAIGDAPKIRRHSLVLYSGSSEAIGHRLAAQLRCKSVRIEGRGAVVVLLGRDAASRAKDPLAG